MSKHYKEKALLATTYKIQSLKEQSNFFKKNLNKVIILGVAFSFCAPFYSGENGKTVKELSEVTYTDSVLLTAAVVFALCLIAHVSWTIQDKLRLKRLLKRKKELEDEIKTYDL